MRGKLLYDRQSLDGMYNKTLSSGGFCANVYRKGLIISLPFQGSIASFSPIELEVIVEVGDRRHTGVVPGRFVEATRSSRGKPIPNRIFLSLPFSWEIPEKQMREATMLIGNIYSADGASIFDGFKEFR